MKTLNLKRLVVLIFLLPLLLAGQTPKNAPLQPQTLPANAPQAQTATVPQTTVLKKTVAFITLDCEDGDKHIQLKGTGFFISIPDSRLGQNGSFVYLVTNRHMVEPEEEHRKLRVTKRTIRLNLKKQGAGFNSLDGDIPLGVRWFFPKDSSVDLAVLPMAPDFNIFDYQAFPISLFATKDIVESKVIAEGDPVLFCGFFYQYPGQKKMQPIIRQGILAMMPDENLTTTLGKPGRIYLTEAHVFGGNSGSPMFVNILGLRNGALDVGGFSYRLLGVVSGYYPETEDLRLEEARTLSGRIEANSGISMVVPVDELKTLLDLPELKDQRETEIRLHHPPAP